MTNPAIDWLTDYWLALESFEVFLDEHVWIEDKVTNEVIDLKLWPGQREKLDTFLSEDLLVILKAHQLGWTWIFVAAYSLWLSLRTPLHQVIINSFNEDVGIEIMTRIRFIRERLPKWMVPEIGTDNNLMMEFVHHDEKGVPTPATIQVIAATEKGGQSKTPNVMFFDESCYNRWVSKAYNGSMPGITQAKGKMILISNAIKTAPGWPFTRSLYSGSMTDANDFKRIFQPWWANPGRSRKVIAGQFDGKGQPMTEFKLQMLRSGGTDGGMMTEEDFSQRYPETEEEAISTMLGSYFGATLARHNQTMKGVAGDLLIGGKSPADVVDMKRHIQDTGGEIEFAPNPRGILEVWRFPYYLVEGWNNDWWTGMYGIGADVSEGLGLSYSVAYGIDRSLDEIIFRLRSNRIDAFSWANYLYTLGMWYRSATSYTEKGLTYEDACICVERTGAGQTTVDQLKKLNANQYMTEVLGTAGAPIKKTFGWNESEQSKHDLSEGLRNYFKVTKGTVYCPVLIDECSTWIQYEGSRRLGPEEGKFGDCVIGAGCTVQAGHFMEGSPKKLAPPTKGWLNRWQKEGDAAAVWALN